MAVIVGAQRIWSICRWWPFAGASCSFVRWLWRVMRNRPARRRRPDVLAAKAC